MKTISLSSAILIALLIFISAFYIWGINTVPFHPDETTNIFMSTDAALLFQNPAQLAWQPGQETQLRSHYRLMDAPVTRYLIGMSRGIAAAPVIAADWDWSKNWDQNLAAGALPDSRTLWVSRLLVTCLIPFGLIGLYFSGKTLGSPWIGIAAVLFFSLNSLVMLHARRAMAEGAMLFGIIFFLAVMLRWPKQVWLLAIAAALAFNAKYSTLALFPVGWLAIFVSRPRGRPSWGWLGKHLLLYSAIFLAITFLLNPFLWRTPVQAFQAAVHERLTFVQGQVNTLEGANPNQILRTPGERVVGMLAELFLTPPAIYDVGNYVANTAPSETAYRGIPGHLLTANWIWSGVSLILILFGGITALWKIGRWKSSAPADKNIFLLGAATLCQFLALILSVPIPYQRYYLPMLPFFCLWSAYGLSILIQPLGLKLREIQIQKLEAPPV